MNPIRSIDATRFSTWAGPSLALMLDDLEAIDRKRLQHDRLPLVGVLERELAIRHGEP